MTLAKTQFRWLLVVYCAVEACGLLADSSRISMIPESVRQVESASRHEVLLNFSQPMKRAMVVTLGCCIATTFVSVIGMFYFWRPALYLYLVMIGVSIMIQLLWTWKTQTRWDSFFGLISHLMAGIIIAFALFGPAKHLFQEKDTAGL
jgi:hypothetical protein